MHKEETIINVRQNHSIHAITLHSYASCKVDMLTQYYLYCWFHLWKEVLCDLHDTSRLALPCNNSIGISVSVIALVIVVTCNCLQRLFSGLYAYAYERAQQHDPALNASTCVDVHEPLLDALDSIVCLARLVVPCALGSTAVGIVYTVHLVGVGVYRQRILLCGLLGKAYFSYVSLLCGFADRLPYVPSRKVCMWYANRRSWFCLWKKSQESQCKSWDMLNTVSMKHREDNRSYPELPFIQYALLFCCQGDKAITFSHPMISQVLDNTLIIAQNGL